MVSSSPNPFDEIGLDLGRAMGELGNRVAEKVRDDCSVPVEYVAAPGVGPGRFQQLATDTRRHYEIIRSKRGEHPRMETRRLVFSIENEPDEGGTGVTATLVSSDVGYALELEEKLDRPIFRDVPDEFGEQFETLCGDVVEGKVTRG